MQIDFEKMEGLGNDFILLDNRKESIAGGDADEQKKIYADLARKLCSRNFGIGADGIILILPSESEDVGFRIFNADGSEAQMCGNGMRCFARHLFENGIMTQTRFNVETLAGKVVPELILNADGSVQAICVDMGEPILEPQKIPFQSTDSQFQAINRPVTVNGTAFNLTAVSMGNPHAVIFVDNVTDTEVETYGRAIENHPLFPEKTNVEFIEVVDPRKMKMRVWERGAGETLACGTGACAALVAANLNGKTGREATIHLRGGDLTIEWRESNNHIYKTGPATSVFKGRIDL